MNESLNIVVVEDDEGLNKLICKRLSREKHHPVGFHKAEEAIAWLNENSADLLLIDLVLPDYSGEELISMLHKNNITVPFIVATGQGSESIAVKMLKKGARDYLVKNSEFLNTLPAAVEMVWREIQLENLLAKAREQINIQNARLQAVQEFSPDGILVIDNFDNINSYNSRFLALWDISEKDMQNMTGTQLFELIANRTDDAAKFLNTISNIGDSKGLILEDIKTDTNRFLELHSASVADDIGNPINRIWYFRDITTHKEAEESKERARIAAEQNARMRSQFFAVISHDVKAPLNSILGFISLLENSGLDEKQKEYIEVIKSSGNHLLTLINDILDLSKIEHGVMQFNIQPMSVSEIIEDCMRTFIPTSQETGVELIYEADDNLPQIVYGDMLRLRQIIINLLNNAFKFTRKGYVKISAKRLNDEFIKISVRDTGIGIDKDVQKFIFHPFLQADGSITQKYGGSGLGLAITKQLVEKFGGEIFLTSELNKGSEFAFTMPVRWKNEKTRTDNNG